MPKKKTFDRSQVQTFAVVSRPAPPSFAQPRLSRSPQHGAMLRRVLSMRTSLYRAHVSDTRLKVAPCCTMLTIPRHQAAGAMIVCHTMSTNSKNRPRTALCPRVRVPAKTRVLKYQWRERAHTRGSVRFAHVRARHKLEASRSIHERSGFPRCSSRAAPRRFHYMLIVNGSL